jgi:Undecaprenyl-phosphate glucose phosphotransferase
MSAVREARAELASARTRSRRWFAISPSYESLAPLVAAFDFIWIISLSIASGVTYHLIAIGSTGDLAQHLGCGIAVAALFSMSARACDLYGWSDLHRLTAASIRDTLFIWTMVFFCLLTVAFTLKISDRFSRGAILLFFLTGMLGLVGARAGIARALTNVLSSEALSARRVALITDLEAQAQTELAIAFSGYGYVITRIFEIGRTQLNDGALAVPEVLRYVRQSQLDEIILAIPWSNAPLIEAISAELRALPIPVRLVPDPVIGRLLERPILELGPVKVVELQRAPLTASQRAVKQALDIAFAGIASVLLAPAFVLIAIIIRLDSSGPIMFMQKRAGFNGRPFRIYKFRTMTTLDDGSIVRQARQGDERVTRAGRVLRRWSFDELPQLLNVLRGEMSLVGPRPHALAHDSEFDKLIANYAIRQKMKPGITGLAQINGCRGETPHVDMMRRRVEYDLQYIDCWSVWIDLRILATTVLQVFIRRDAY